MKNKLPLVVCFLASLAIVSGCDDLETIPVSAAVNGGQGGVAGGGGQGGAAGQGGAGASGNAGNGGAGEAGKAGAAGVAGKAGEAGAGGSAAGAAGKAGAAGTAGKAGAAGTAGAAGAAGTAGAAGAAGIGPFSVDCAAPKVSNSKGACVKIDDTVTCNLVTNEGCADNEICNFAGAGTVSCFPIPSDATVCDACNNATGPICESGTFCVKGTCARFCCDDNDCGPGATCTVQPLKVSQQNSGAGVCVVLGAGGSGGAGGAAGAAGAAGAGLEADCTAPAVAKSAGACLALGGDVECNLVTNEGCKEGETCDFSPKGSTCYPPPNNANLCDACTLNGPYCSAGNACYKGQCLRYCCDDVDCTDGAKCTKQVFPDGFPALDVGVCAK